MNRQQIEALPNDPASLKREVIRLSELVSSYEQAKRQRAAEVAAAAASPAASFKIDVFNAKSNLEALSDGSEDFTDPLVRGRICREAIGVLSRMFEALPKT